MSLLPFLLSDPWETFRPSRIVDQHFGLGLQPEDLLSPLTYPVLNRHATRLPSPYYRPWTAGAASGDTGSYVNSDKNKFEVNLDVQQFNPNEINVKVSGNNVITVEGKHDEKQDEHGFVYRHFVRRYVLPEGHDVNNATSKLSSDGVLSITVPRTGENAEKYRAIPIQQTGAPLKSVASKTKQDGGVCKKQEAADACLRNSQDSSNACQRSCPRKD